MNAVRRRARRVSGEDCDPMNPTWSERIRMARERGYFTIDDQVAAGLWSSCAMAECRYKKSIGSRCPTDQRLMLLGIGFSLAIHQRDFESAERLIRSIKRRAKAIT